MNDPRDAEDAVYDLNGKSLLGMRVIVELAKGKPRGYGGAYRSDYSSSSSRRRPRSSSRDRDRRQKNLMTAEKNLRKKLVIHEAGLHGVVHQKRKENPNVMGQQVHHEKKALVNVTKKRALGIVVLAEATAVAKVQMTMRRMAMAMVETLHAALLRKKTHVLQKEIIAQDLAHHVAQNHLAQGKVKMMIELFLSTHALPFPWPYPYGSCQEPHVSKQTNSKPFDQFESIRESGAIPDPHFPCQTLYESSAISITFPLPDPFSSLSPRFVSSFQTPSYNTLSPQNNED
uniref:Uncharacterized protein n=1 Tax=Acrobeloides nanus TaxID=290746 RepID=A0A914E084_9BILA